MNIFWLTSFQDSTKYLKRNLNASELKSLLIKVKEESEKLA